MRTDRHNTIDPASAQANTNAVLYPLCAPLFMSFSLAGGDQGTQNAASTHSTPSPPAAHVARTVHTVLRQAYAAVAHTYTLHNTHTTRPPSTTAFVFSWPDRWGASSPPQTPVIHTPPDGSVDSPIFTFLHVQTLSIPMMFRDDGSPPSHAPPSTHALLLTDGHGPLRCGGAAFRHARHVDASARCARAPANARRKGG